MPGKLWILGKYKSADFNKHFVFLPRRVRNVAEQRFSAPEATAPRARPPARGLPIMLPKPPRSGNFVSAD